MKKLLIFLILSFSVTFFVSCGQTTDPRDNGLPTMEEVIKEIQKHEFKSYALESQKDLLSFYSEEKQFFYESINNIYFNNPNNYGPNYLLEENMGVSSYTELMNEFSLKYFKVEFSNHHNAEVKIAIRNYYMGLQQLMSEKSSN